MHEERFWQSLTDGAGVFRTLVVVIVIALIVFIVLRVVMPMVNDRRTRKILIQGMSSDELPGGDLSSGEPSTNEPSTGEPGKPKGETSPATGPRSRKKKRKR